MASLKLGFVAAVSHMALTSGLSLFDRCIAGDTDMTEDNRKVKCDVAMIPIGGTYTMDAMQAAQLINEIKPDIAIPTHYGSAVGSPKDADTFKEQVNSDIEVVIKMEY